jgi:nitrite reductase/ring-hydroxylating ferredoxin subunit
MAKCRRFETGAAHELSTFDGNSEWKGCNMPLHGARFDVITGKKVGEPMAPDPSKFPEPLPESLQRMFARTAEITSKVKTYDQSTYETKVEGNKVKVIR